MKAETICAIKDILEQNYKTASANFNNIERSLRDKYGANYNTSVTLSERSEYLSAAHKVDGCIGLLEDFNKHNWN